MTCILCGGSKLAVASERMHDENDPSVTLDGHSTMFQCPACWPMFVAAPEMARLLVGQAFPYCYGCNVHVGDMADGRDRAIANHAPDCKLVAVLRKAGVLP